MTLLSMLLALALLLLPQRLHALQPNHQHHQQQSPSSSSTDVSSPSSSRRDFLGQTAASTAAAAASTSPLWIPGVSNGADDAPPPQEAPPKSVLESQLASSLKLPPMGLGCWSWGDSLFWGYDKKNDAELQQVFDYAISNHAPILVDTAELYGLGRSEQLLGEYSKNVNDDQIVVASKFAALPFRTSSDSVVKACKASIKRLGGQPLDLYQIHFPGAWANEAYWDGIAKCYEQGLVKAIGVSNYGVDAVKACYHTLAKRGIPLATNQIQYNLLYRFPEDNGLLQTCSDLGVQVLSYSPMALGLLTGKYDTPESLEKIVGPRKQLFAKTVGTTEFNELLSTMRQIADKHSDANLPQVAINWCRAKGTIPIPGARNLKQIQSNYAALDWNLTQDEIKQLDEASSKLSYNSPEQSPFRLYDKDLQLNMYDS